MNYFIACLPHFTMVNPYAHGCVFFVGIAPRNVTEFPEGATQYSRELAEEILKSYRDGEWSYHIIPADNWQEELDLIRITEKIR